MSLKHLIIWWLEDAFELRLYNIILFAIVAGLAFSIAGPWEARCKYRLDQEPKRLGETDEEREKRIFHLLFTVDDEDGKWIRRCTRILWTLVPTFMVYLGIRGVFWRTFVSPHPGWGFRFICLAMIFVGAAIDLGLNGHWSKTDYEKCRVLDPQLGEYDQGNVQTGVEASVGEARKNVTAVDSRPNAPENRKPYSQRGKGPKYTTDEYSLHSIAYQYGIGKAEEGEASYKGYKAVSNDGGGQPDPLLVKATAHPVWFSTLKKKALMYGEPGSGLGSSDFGQAAKTGAVGEKDLAKIIAASRLPVVSFWSLYGFDKDLKKIDADIDCVLAGVDEVGTVHLWFVDAKNYKGGSDTVYVPADEQNKLLRISKSKHAFVVNKTGDASLKQSSQMAFQLDNWQKKWAQDPSLPKVATHWRVCSVPTGENGTPEFHADLKWPGGIKAVTVGQLVDEIKHVQLQHSAMIPTKVIELLKSLVKGLAPAQPGDAERDQELRDEEYAESQKRSAKRKAQQKVKASKADKPVEENAHQEQTTEEAKPDTPSETNKTDSAEHEFETVGSESNETASEPLTGDSEKHKNFILMPHSSVGSEKIDNTSSPSPADTDTPSSDGNDKQTSKRDPRSADSNDSEETEPVNKPVTGNSFHVKANFKPLGSDRSPVLKERQFSIGLNK